MPSRGSLPRLGSFGTKPGSVGKESGQGWVSLNKGPVFLQQMQHSGIGSGVCSYKTRYVRQEGGASASARGRASV